MISRRIHEVRGKEMIRGERVSIKFIDRGDVDAIVELFNDRESSEMGLALRDTETVSQCTVVQPKLREEGYVLIVENHSGEAIGGIYYKLKLRSLQALWAGVMVRGYRKKGHFTEAMYLLGKYLFDTFPIHKVESQIVGENAACRAWSEKFGMKEEGVLRETWFCGGRLRDLVYVGILREEFYAKYREFMGGKDAPENVAVLAPKRDTSGL